MKKFIYLLLSILIYQSMYAGSIVSISPESGICGSFVEWEITTEGTNFTKTITLTEDHLRNVDFVKGNQRLTSNNLQIVSPTKISGNIYFQYTDELGDYDIEVVGQDSDGKEIILVKENAFTIRQGEPRFISITPNTSETPNKLEVTLVWEDYDFRSHMTSYTPNMYDKEVKSVILSKGNNVFSNAVSPSGVIDTAIVSLNIDQFTPAGIYNVTIHEKRWAVSHYYTAQSAFTVTKESDKNITSVTPNNAKQEDELQVTITAENVDFVSENQNHVFTKINGAFLQKEATKIIASKITEVDSASFTANFIIPAKIDPGTYDVCVGGVEENVPYALVVDDGFTIIPKQKVREAEPDSAKRGEPFIMQISGIEQDLSSNRVTNVYLKYFEKIDKIEGKIDISKIKNKNKILSEIPHIYAGAWTTIDENHLEADFKIPKDANPGDYSVVVELNSIMDVELPAQFTVSQLTGVEEHKLASDIIKVSPNPANDIITINCENTLNGLVQLTIYDERGIEVINQEYNMDFKNSEIQTDLLAQGSYLVKLVSGNHIYYTKFVIVR